jgi:FPC/CPF motif-containing protein YcgG
MDLESCLQLDPHMSRGKEGCQNHPHVIEGLSFSRPRASRFWCRRDNWYPTPVDQYSADIPEDISSIAWGFLLAAARSQLGCRFPATTSGTMVTRHCHVAFQD